MLLLDVNVLIAAHREDHPDHPGVRGWFDAMLAGDAAFSVPAVVWGSFLRLVTNWRIFPVPTPVSAAFDFIDAVGLQPHHLLLGPGERHLTLLRRMCDEGEAVGDLVPAAVLAAIALEHGCEIVTLDRDFARFPFVPHRSPLVA